MRDEPASFTRESELIEKILENVRGTIPLGIEHLETILRLIAAGTARLRNCLDLSCCGGVLTAAVITEHPEVETVFLDTSTRRIEAARQQFGEKADGVTFNLARFADPGWVAAAASAGPYDLIVSGVELPMLPDERQRPFFAEICGLLEPGGLFLAVQHVASATRWTQSPWDDRMIETIFGEQLNEAKNRPRIEVARAFYERLVSGHRQVAPLEVQCDWLRELGLESVECFLKISELAIFGGQKPGAPDGVEEA